MTRRKVALEVDEDLSDLIKEFLRNSNLKKDESHTIEEALGIVLNQMKAVGMRTRTIEDYQLQVNHFADVTSVEMLQDVTAEHIYEWLASMNVNNQTKLTRLKCLKAFLSRCLDNGWVKSRFWAHIKIKVDSSLKEGANEKDIMELLSYLDLSRFIQLRDAAAILLMFQTGIRIGTLGEMKESDVYLKEGVIKLQGEIIKNHKPIVLPFDDTLKKLFDVLIRQNQLVREEYNVSNDYLFITQYGDKIASGKNNGIKRRLYKYSRDYNLENISPHAIRRGFARRLLDKGADVVLISKALGHSGLDVTTRYLHMNTEEVSNRLRDYL
ncbi:tyrosine-type recombinase/integrase [Halalkalibacter oceani]|uniref:tyrosine-type recombinase/integrase n=1 Tax=Halalkalibacter oceani TaxID=1653776 RepID=UPI003399C33A